MSDSAEELGLNNNSSLNTYIIINNLSANDIINKNIRELKIRFRIDNIAVENHRSPDMYWMAKMYKNPINTRFFIVSPKSAIKPLARTITSVFRLPFIQIQTHRNNCRFVTRINTFKVARVVNVKLVFTD